MLNNLFTNEEFNKILIPYNVKIQEMNRHHIAYMKTNYNLDITKYNYPIELTYHILSILHEVGHKISIENHEFNFKEEAQKSNTDRYNWKVNLNKYLKGNRQEKILPKYDKKVLEYFPKIYHEDWLDYGISEETMDKYNIRYYPYKNQIVIPCYDHNGNMCGIRIRNMNKELLETTDIPKYMPLKMLDGTEYKFPTNLCFYGENFNSQIIKKKKQVF